jgi:hypothetical protein
MLSPAPVNAKVPPLLTFRFLLPLPVLMIWPPDSRIGAVVSGGVVEVGNGIVDVLSGGSANVKFPSNGSGGLVIEDSPNDVSAFTGAVSGFGGANHANGGSVELGPARTFPRAGIDLPDIAFGAQTTLAYAANAAGAGGTLTIGDGRQAAAIALLGNYMAGSFVTTADGQGGTLLTQAAQTGQQLLLTHPKA